MEIDTGNICSNLKRKLLEADGPYHKIWLALQADNELTAIVRSRQLHIYRNGKMEPRRFWIRPRLPVYEQGMGWRLCWISWDDGEYGRPRPRKRQHMDRKILENDKILVHLHLAGGKRRRPVLWDQPYSTKQALHSSGSLFLTKSNTVPVLITVVFFWWRRRTWLGRSRNSLRSGRPGLRAITFEFSSSS